MTDEELTQIRERVERATEEPWVPYDFRRDIPKLLAEIERLKGVTEDTEQEIDEWRDGYFILELELMDRDE